MFERNVDILVCEMKTCPLSGDRDILSKKWRMKSKTLDFTGLSADSDTSQLLHMQFIFWTLPTACSSTSETWTLSNCKCPAHDARKYEPHRVLVILIWWASIGDLVWLRPFNWSWLLATPVSSTLHRVDGHGSICTWWMEIVKSGGLTDRTEKSGALT